MAGIGGSVLILKQKKMTAKVIAVDVDGTLLHRGIVSKRLVAWCKAKKTRIRDDSVVISW